MQEKNTRELPDEVRIIKRDMKFAMVYGTVLLLVALVAMYIRHGILAALLTLYVAVCGWWLNNFVHTFARMRAFEDFFEGTEDDEDDAR